MNEDHFLPYSGLPFLRTLPSYLFLVLISPNVKISDSLSTSR